MKCIHNFSRNCKCDAFILLTNSRAEFVFLTLAWLCRLGQSLHSLSLISTIPYSICHYSIPLVWEVVTHSGYHTALLRWRYKLCLIKGCITAAVSVFCIAVFYPHFNTRADTHKCNQHANETCLCFMKICICMSVHKLHVSNKKCYFLASFKVCRVIIYQVQKSIYRM